jgi:hypothetical protein
MNFFPFNIKLLFFIFLTVSGSIVFSQSSYSAGSIGTGFGVYHAKFNDTKIKDTTTINSACGLLSLNYEYVHTNGISVGIHIGRNGFYIGRDSAGKSPNITIVSYNYGLSGKYRFVNQVRSGVYFAAILGFSYLKVTETTTFKNIHGNGYNIQAGMGWDHYFTDRIGMFLAGYYTLYKYNQLYDQGNNIIKVNNPQENETLKFEGMNGEIGMLLKF